MSFVKRYVERRSKEDPEFKKLYEEELQKTIKYEKFVEDDGSITLSTVDIDIVVNEEHTKNAHYLLCESLIEYAKEYRDNFDQYFNSPNRKKHLKQVEGILECDYIEEVLHLTVMINGDS